MDLAQIKPVSDKPTKATSNAEVTRLRDELELEKNLIRQVRILWYKSQKKFAVSEITEFKLCFLYVYDLTITYSDSPKEYNYLSCFNYDLLI